MTLKPRMPLLAQYVGLPPSCAGNGDMMRGLPGGSRSTALSQKVTEALWKPSKRNAKRRAAKSLRALTRLYCMALGWKMPASHSSLRIADRGAELVRLDRRRELAGLVVE